MAEPWSSLPSCLVPEGEQQLLKKSKSIFFIRSTLISFFSFSHSAHLSSSLLSCPQFSFFFLFFWHQKDGEDLLLDSIYGTTSAKSSSSSSIASFLSVFNSLISPDPEEYQTPGYYSTPSPPPAYSSHHMAVPQRPSLVAKSCSLPSDCPLQRLAQLDELGEVEGGSALDLVGPPASVPYGGAVGPGCGGSSATVNECASISALIVTPPSPDSFRRAHRHSIPGHRLNNYLKFLNELAAKGSSTAHLFSTAVISGSSSAPNLKEMPQPREGLGESLKTFPSSLN